MSATRKTIDIESIQAAIQAAQLDGWLFHAFRDLDPISRRILKLDLEALETRRWFYLLPATGDPVKLCHSIERGALDNLPGSKSIYLSWKELRDGVGRLVSGKKRIAMQYSPDNSIPYVSRVDAGTVELIRSFGVEVVSSADLVQRFEAVLTDEQIETHVRAARHIREVMDNTFREVAERVHNGSKTTEYGIQQLICDQFRDRGLVFDHPPIVGIDAHAGDPHYEPPATGSSQVETGQLLLMDIWAREDHPDAIYADITWTGFLGKEVPDKIRKVFDVVCSGRDAGIRRVKEAIEAGKPIRGCDVDDATRGVIQDAGYGEYFIHRTGHSLGREVHGNGANMDNLETQDVRQLLPNTAFTIEPGVYLPEFGIRSEVNLYLQGGKVVVSGEPVQTEVLALLKT
jgi:Xaa-Pro aminopeptidase